MRVHNLILISRIWVSMINIFNVNCSFIWIVLVLLLSQEALNAQITTIEVTPETYNKALRNPLKGFTTRGIYYHEWATLAHSYIKWNEIENDESDDINKIIQVLDSKWEDVELRNIKVIPRIYLHWDGEKTYWPADMITGDYTSEQFEERVLRLIKRLGVIWDTDPRVAFVEMGIFGKWGEQHSPFPSNALETKVSDAFIEAFPNKLVSVRKNWENFLSQPFGEYWDSWGHYDQMWGNGERIAELNTSDDRYITNYIGGEVAYDWGNSYILPGQSPTETVVSLTKRNFMINSIRWLHCTQLRWIEDYDKLDSLACIGADLIQKAFGYRYILEKVKFSSTVINGNLQVSFDVKNVGSAPFYYNWPVEVSLIDTITREVVWNDTFKSVNICNWLPGNGWGPPDWIEASNWSQYYPDTTWSATKPEWSIPPTTYQETGNFNVTVPTGRYILALAILDPAGMLPSVRFATCQYFTGGRHPIGMVAVNEGQGHKLSESIIFDDPAKDITLHYSHDVIPVSIKSNKQIEKIEVFPNPAQDNVTIRSEFGDISVVEIINYFGELILQKKLKDEETVLDVSKIESGIYLFRIRQEANEPIIKTIIIQ